MGRGGCYEAGGFGDEPVREVTQNALHSLIDCVADTTDVCESCSGSIPFSLFDWTI
jgi:hypothetical protein